MVDNSSNQVKRNKLSFFDGILRMYFVQLFSQERCQPVLGS